MISIWHRLYTIALLFMPYHTIAAGLNSVKLSEIELVEKYEDVTNLDLNKYAPKQYKEISNLLSNRNKFVRFVTYNMLFDIKDKSLAPINRWPSRLPRITKIINKINPDILCTQELHKNQVNDLLNTIGYQYEFYGKNNPHANEEGAIDGIFIRKERFSLIQHKTFLIPFIKNKKKVSEHTLIMLKLVDKKTGQLFSVFNTHLTYYSAEQREHSAEVISKKIETAMREGPVVLAGDFNTLANRPDIADMPFYDGDYIKKILTRDLLVDTMENSALGHIGPLSTFTDKTDDDRPFKGTGIPGIILDHIFTTKDILTVIHAVESTKVNGHYPSDHMPVIIDCLISNKLVK